MRSFKKVLTLALVFAMAIGLLSVGALNFSDADDIQYKEAVEVMVGIGAINGYTDGTFRPDGLVTRAEAAKLVTYAILTPKVAEYLPKGTSSFDDVPANHWAAPYIEYCVSQGIVNGRGNGKFDPNGNVTAFELAKMLLTAAGYGRNNEYVGATWSLNVVTDAIDNGIFTGTKATNYGAPATREEAALYVFNGLTKVDQVKFSKDTESYVLTVDGGQTIGEQKYGLARLAKNPNGVSGYVWIDRNDKELSSFIVTDNILGTSMSGIPFKFYGFGLAEKSKTNPFYIAEIADEAVYFVNGVEVTEFDTAESGYAKGDCFIHDGEVYEATETISKGEAFNPAKARNLAGTKGVIVNFADNLPADKRDGKADKITIIRKSVVTLSADPVVTKAGKVKISGITGVSGVDPENVVGYEGLSRGDVVLYYKVGDVYYLELAEAVTGKITAKKTDKDGNVQIVFGGTSYQESGLQEEAIFEGLTNNDYNVDAVAYLDNNGYIVALRTEADDVDHEYAVLLDWALIKKTGWASDDYYEAKLLFMDGTTKIVTWASVDGKDVAKLDGGDTARDALENKFYTYTVNSLGAYELTTAEGNADGSGKPITPNRVKFDETNVGDASTVFIVNGSVVGKPNSYVVYKGIGNVPKIVAEKEGSSVATAILQEDSLTKYVYVYSGKLDTATDDTVYFVSTAYTYYPKTSTTAAYREYVAIVDGELTTVKVADTLDSESEPVDAGLHPVLASKNGVITKLGKKIADKVGTVGASNGIITLGKEGSYEYFTYNNNTVVFFISSQNVVTEGTVADIEENADSEYTVISDSVVEDLAAVVIIRE